MIAQHFGDAVVRLEPFQEAVGHGEGSRGLSHCYSFSILCECFVTFYLMFRAVADKHFEMFSRTVPRLHGFQMGFTNGTTIFMVTIDADAMLSHQVSFRISICDKPVIYLWQFHPSFLGAVIFGIAPD